MLLHSLCDDAALAEGGCPADMSPTCSQFVVEMPSKLVTTLS